MAATGDAPDCQAIAAALAARWSAPLPQQVRAAAGLAVADYVGAVCAGAVEPEQAALRAHLLGAAGREGPCSVIPGPARADARTAAFLNACAATAGELDDRLPEARTHPAAHVIPVAAALAEEAGRTGADFLRAVALGYEAAALLGGCFPERTADLHPHGYWTTGAAAVAAAALSGLPVKRLADLLGCAVLFGPRLPFASAWQGATVRNAYAGLGVQVALHCLDCAEAGITAPADAIAFVRAQVGIAAPPRAVDSASWAVERTEFKFLPVCNSLHPVVRAVRAMALPRPAGEIEAIRVTGPQALAGFMSPAAPNALARRFNLRFTLAEELLHRHAPGRALHLDDAAVAALAARVSLAIAPGRYRVAVRYRDGAVEQDVSEQPPAIAPDELSARVREKFAAVAAPVLGAAGAEALWSALMRIDAAERLDLGALLHPGRAS